MKALTRNRKSILESLLILYDGRNTLTFGKTRSMFIKYIKEGRSGYKLLNSVLIVVHLMGDTLKVCGIQNHLKILKKSMFILKIVGTFKQILEK